MKKKLFILLISYFLIFIGHLYALEDITLKKQKWTFEGLFGRYDNASLQRGLQVYQEVCSTCHGIKRLRFRELKNLGFTETQIKEYAATFEILDGPNEMGELFLRPGEPSDTFISPYKNKEEATAAFGGAYPLDLSLITKARKGGANYIYSLLTGYEENVPENFNLGDGLYYNLYKDGRVIAMPPPIYDDAIEYIDGTNASLHQLSYDIVNFLNWVAEPELQKRKSLGLKVLIFLIVLTLLLYVTMKEIWSRIEK